MVNGAPECGSKRKFAQKARRVAEHEVRDNGSGSSEGASLLGF